VFSSLLLDFLDHQGSLGCFALVLGRENGWGFNAKLPLDYLAGKTLQT